MSSTSPIRQHILFLTLVANIDIDSSLCQHNFKTKTRLLDTVVRFLGTFVKINRRKQNWLLVSDGFYPLGDIIIR